MTRSVWDVASDVVDPRVEGYQSNPVAWAGSHGVNLWSKQRDILDSIVVNDQTAVQACHTAGKSFTAALAVCWWIEAHPPGSAIAVTTAPTGDQVKAILWREMNRHHNRLGLSGHMNLTEWYVAGELVAMGRKPREYDTASFTGIHEEYVLLVYDEASGIPASLFEAGSSLVSNDTSRTLAIGNPDNAVSEFAKKCRPGSGWDTIKISAFDCPNFTGEQVAPIINRTTISRGWAEARRLEYGEESPFWIARVLGEFPEDAENGVVPNSWAQQCRVLDLDPGEPVRLGVDVGAGGDQSVIRCRRGEVAAEVWRSRHGDPERLTDEIVAAAVSTDAEEILIDSNGIGWGIAGWLRSRRGREHNALVTPVNVASRSSEPKRFKNLRSEMWWNIGRGLCQSHGWDLGDCDDGTIAELVAPKYSIDSAGRIVVEPKDDVRKRLGRSPDDADALLLAFLESRSRLESAGQQVREARIGGVRRR